MTDQQHQIEQLMAKVSELEARIDGRPVATPEPQSSRRQLLKLAGAAVAGAAASGIVAGNAAATNGEPVTLGDWKTASSPTRTDMVGTMSVQGGQAFLFQAGAGGFGTFMESAALAGFTVASDVSTGVFGRSSHTNGVGVLAKSFGTSSLAAGMHAVCDASLGTGLKAESAYGVGIDVKGGQWGILANSTITGGIGVQGTSTDYVGVWGAGQTGTKGVGNPNGYGVDGSAFGTTGVGVIGTGPTGVKAVGSGQTSIGLHAIAPQAVYAVGSGSYGIGVNAVGVAAVVAQGTSSTGTGLIATGDIGARVDGTRFGLSSSGARAAMKLTAGSASKPTPPARTDAHEVGEIEVDQLGELWYCVAAGTPGTWRTLSGPNTAGQMHFITPIRVYDSRKPSAQPIHTNTTRTISIANAINRSTGAVVTANAIPAGSTGIAYNLTLINTVASGYLTINPGGVTVAGTSTCQWTAPGQVLSMGSTIGTSTTRKVTVIAGGAATGATHFIIDVVGYYR